MSKPIIGVLQGDQTGQELLDESAARARPGGDALSIVDFRPFDLSLENRRETKNQVVHEAAERIKETGLGIKAATITPGNPDDVGSPNALLREWINGQVILRTGRRIPAVRPLAGVYAPISVVRMAVEDAYGAEEWREGEGLDEVAYSTAASVAAQLPRGGRIHLPLCPAQQAPKSSADRNTLSARSTKACSKRKWTPRTSATRTCATIRS